LNIWLLYLENCRCKIKKIKINSKGGIYWCRGEKTEFEKEECSRMALANVQADFVNT
jgi:hypothetical protein